MASASDWLPALSTVWTALFTVCATMLTVLNTSWTYGTMFMSWAWEWTKVLLALATWPVTTTVAVLLVLCSPAIYMAQYALAPLGWVWGLLPALETLYIFFGCATLLGLFAGLSLRLTSFTLASTLGMYNPSSPSTTSHLRRRKRSGSDLDDSISTYSADSLYYDLDDVTDPRGKGKGKSRLLWGSDRDSSSDVPSWSSSDLRTLGIGGGKGSGGVGSSRGVVTATPNSGKRRRGVPGLLQRETIHEEEDDESE